MEPLSPTQPVLGILTHAIQAAEPSQLCGPLTQPIKDVVEHAQQLGWTAYVYSPRDLLKQRRLVWGWTRSDGGWTRDFFPIPHVSYVRNLAWHADDAPIIQWLKQETGTQFLNNPDVEDIVHDRWRVIQIGLSHPTLNERFPDSALLRPGSDLRGMLAQHNRWNVFNRFRSGEPRFAHVVRKADEFSIRFVARTVAHTLSLKRAADVQDKLLYLFGEAVVQQYHEPIRFESCPIAIRSVWQRSRTLRWEETCALIRVGKEQSTAGPMTTVGIFEQCTPLFEQVLGPRTEAVRYQAQSVARSVVELLDHRGHGASELAVDIVPLEDGRVFVSEVSTIGGVDSLRRLAQPLLRQRMVAATMSYASALYEQHAVLSEPSPVPSRTG